MNILYVLLIIININLVVTNRENENEDKLKTFPKKLLARRREEHLVLLKNIAKNPKYEWRFRLVEVGVTKVFELINENRVRLKDTNEMDEEKLSQAKMLIIENTCLLMDFIVNFNQDIYKIFNIISKKNVHTDWRVMLKVSFEFLSKEKELLDELTSKEYDFIMENYEKINNEETLPDYPYENNIKRDINIAERIYQDETEKLKALKKKEKKKLKKGPSLRGVEL
ncbi:hypothetical protein PVAND_011867 [Polypedilum vanderplanki]|uniref:Uncharacterized protein n=1 Tax=Polypedilum vanderplanki TaxID=319348 RepID=A0A9J6CKY2_POLVA|nr:hypothetical protein PVAND_011867 [Polypedilum vanderplanki]